MTPNKAVKYQPKQRIIRKSEVLDTLGISKSTLFNRINDGVLPPSISLGGRAVGWLESEIQIILHAFASSRSKNELRSLVQHIIASRKSLGNTH